MRVEGPPGSCHSIAAHAVWDRRRCLSLWQIMPPSRLTHWRLTPPLRLTQTLTPSSTAAWGLGLRAPPWLWDSRRCLSLEERDARLCLSRAVRSAHRMRLTRSGADHAPLATHAMAAHASLAAHANAHAILDCSLGAGAAHPSLALGFEAVPLPRGTGCEAVPLPGGSVGSHRMRLTLSGADHAPSRLTHWRLTPPLWLTQALTPSSTAAWVPRRCPSPWL